MQFRTLVIVFCLFVCRLGAESHRLGDFHVNFDDLERTHITVTHINSPLKIVWSTRESKSFLNFAIVKRRIRYDRASFDFNYKIEKECKEQTVERIYRENNSLFLKGSFDDCHGVNYQFVFHLHGDNQLGFSTGILDDKRFNLIKIIYESNKKEFFYGFGEQFSNQNFKGKRLPIWCEEQGHGRGIQPLTFIMRVVGAGLSAGKWHTTYSCVPFYLTNFSRGFFVKNYHHLYFDMTKENEMAVEVFDNKLEGTIINGNTPLDILEEFTRFSGRMRPLPSWTQNGAIIRVSGGEEKIFQTLDTLKKENIPVSALWIEDWVGKRRTLTGMRLWWNWSPNKDYYPNWEELLKKIKSRGVRVITYFNPYLSEVNGRGPFDRILFDEARDKGFLIKDKWGAPYMFGAGFFSAAIIDLANPLARSWLKDIMIEQLNMGVSGWMADFGEAVPLDAVFFSRESAETYHAKFPTMWAKLNDEILRSNRLIEKEPFFFSRSGSLFTHKYTRLFWTGDQLVSWDNNDGIKSVIPALTSSGMSGWTLNHTDIGGYFSIDFFIKKHVRDKDLYFRWAEISLFTPLFRTHSTTRPDINYQWDQDEDSIQLFSKFVNLFVALSPLRKKLMIEAYEKGYPLIRHPVLHYPDDEEVQKLSQQFMYGKDIMVAPVVEKNSEIASVYLPKAQWVHLWSLKQFDSPGKFFQVEAPLGRPAIFFLKGSKEGLMLHERVMDLGLIN